MAKINLDQSQILTAEQKFDSVREAKVADAQSYGNALQLEGFPYDFGGDYGVLHLQMRNAQDQANWLTARQNMQDAIDAGYGDQPVAPIHTDENITVMVTPNEGIAILKQLSAWGQALYQNSWAMKAQIRAAQNQAELDKIDYTKGWSH